MSHEIYDGPELQVTRFHGGTVRGPCIQFTDAGGLIVSAGYTAAVAAARALVEYDAIESVTAPSSTIKPPPAPAPLPFPLGVLFGGVPLSDDEQRARDEKVGRTIRELLEKIKESGLGDLF